MFFNVNIRKKEKKNLTKKKEESMFLEYCAVCVQKKENCTVILVGSMFS